MGQLDRIYGRLPLWGQHAAVSTFGLYWKWLRFGPGYRRFTAEYTRRERLSAAQWREWQARRLQHVLTSAAQVPYYRDSWTRSEKAAAAAGRIDALPLLEKEPLRADVRRFLHPGIQPRFPLITPTSGSTGTPINNYWTWREYRDALAVREVRSARWAGVSFRVPRATFSGRMVEPNPQSAGPFHRYNAVERQVYFSAFHLRKENAETYVRALHRHRTVWITGYAVSVYLLAQYVLERDLRTPSTLRAIITTSEKLSADMRQVIQRAFGCRVFEEYSTVENCLFASECQSGALHVSPDVSLVEILRPDGSPCEPGEPGEVVTTCLMRDLQPLIRFRVGDVARWAEQPCPCGRQMPVIEEVLGRMEDVVTGPDGRKMVRFHGLFANQPRIRQGQVIQVARTRLLLKVVPAEGFSSADTEDLRQRVWQRLGPDMTTDVELVREIPRTQSGKFKAVVNLMSEKDHATC